MEIETINCPECNKELQSLDSLRKHRSMLHKVPSEQTYIQYKLNGVEPTCACGCGERPKFLGFDAGYREYKWGHAARVHNNWGHNPEIVKKSHATQKKMYESGELVVWNKGLTKADDIRIEQYGKNIGANKERADKISKSNSGVPKSEEHKRKIKANAIERWSDINERNKQRFRRIDYFKNRLFNKKSILESYFESLLVELNIDFECQFPLKGYLYDFRINNKNILIEVDGDWYHCNPNVHPEAKSVIQKQVTSNDIRKNKIAANNGFKLLRFWETDINHNPEEVIVRLKQELLD